MNCKPGDLAVVVRSCLGNEGRILTCKRLVPPGEAKRLGFGVGRSVWETDTPLKDTWGGFECFTPDDILRPIRGGEGNESWYKAAPLPKVREAA